MFKILPGHITDYPTFLVTGEITNPRKYKRTLFIRNWNGQSYIRWREWLFGNPYFHSQIRDYFIHYLNKLGQFLGEVSK